jgi:hypothetical protein
MPSDFEGITAKNIAEIHQMLALINNTVNQTQADIVELRDQFDAKLEMLEQKILSKFNDISVELD